MDDLFICESCGKVMRDKEDFADGKVGNAYCNNCTNEFGYRERYSQIVDKIKQKLITQMSISEEEAEKMANENVSIIPYWASRGNLIASKKNILITDVGSTTTKALLLTETHDSYEIKAISHAATTVEKPLENVNIGVFNAIRQIEKDISVKLLSEDAASTKLSFPDDTLYLTTSSAGGGLQILVIGLTLFDSASSGKRTAYGAGGVILDTFAIDDKRSSLEQMQAMGVLHPDIILMCGGIDGGAVSPILRLGEILQLANSSPKFGDADSIPLVFAGNVEARALIAGLFSKKFNLFIVPNIRPSLTEENLPPAREKIHQLFMDNVMEQAPGYAVLKEIVSDDIVPTPMSVITSLQLISEKLDENIMAVDIGGATTDIFSNILGEYYRTVSANYGMSYSISNVLKDSGIDNLKKFLPDKLDEDYIYNYIANKMLYPTFNPSSPLQLMIEHAISKEAIRMSKIQHLAMNFNTKEIGFLDKMKLKHHDLDNITEAFYIEKQRDSKKFHMYDINILIGAGGVLSHTTSDRQALAIIDSGFMPEGMTEIWKDKHFVSPHLGKLSALDEKLAAKLLTEDCFEKIGLVIRPIFNTQQPGKEALTITIDDDKQIIKTGERSYFANKTKKSKDIIISMKKGFYLNELGPDFKVTTELPIYVDVCLESDFDHENQVLELYSNTDDITSIEDSFNDFIKDKPIFSGINEHKITLPYKGNILVNKADEVDCETVIGENLFDPPRVYVITLFDKTYLHLKPENIQKSLLIKEGDEVKYGQRIVEIGERTLIQKLQFQHFYFDSPVRGKVEKINLDSGTIIMREIQDYSTKPVKINVAKKLNILPKQIISYLQKGTGDFIYAGDTLAKRILDSANGIPTVISSPTTGTIKEVDSNTGIVVLQYDKKPYKLKAGITGKVKSIEKGYSALISYKGITMQGIIGFGTEAHGKIKFIKHASDLKNCKTDEILIFSDSIDHKILKTAVKRKVQGVIAPSMNNLELVKYIGKPIGVALTGNEDIPFPLIITEGFGNFKLSNNYTKIFAENNGNQIYMIGHTQIRAGVIRPKIIILN